MKQCYIQIEMKITKEDGKVLLLAILLKKWDEKLGCLICLFFIEVKTKKAYFTKTGNITKSKGCSEIQIELHKKLRDMGFLVEVVYDIKTFEDFILSLL